MSEHVVQPRQADDHVPAFRFEAGVVDDRRQHASQVNVFPRLDGRRLESREREQLANQLVQAIGLQLHAIEGSLVLLRLIACNPQRHLQARQRRTQFMRNVAQQTVLRVDQRLDSVRHFVKANPQLADFVPPAHGAIARVEVAAAIAIQGSAQTLHRPCHRSCKRQARQAADEHNDQPLRERIPHRVGRIDRVIVDEVGDCPIADLHALRNVEASLLPCDVHGPRAWRSTQ